MLILVPLRLIQPDQHQPKAGLQGASIEDILKQGSWSNKTTWQRFYHKNIVEEGKIFQEMVFKPA